MAPWRDHWTVAGLTLLAGAAACEPGRGDLPTGRAPASATGEPLATASRVASAVSAAVPSMLPPLAASDGALLAVTGHGAAAVEAPQGATGPRPVALVLHDGRVSPTRACLIWRQLLDRQTCVLCPHGVAPATSPDAPPSQAFADLEGVREEVRSALRALKERYGDYVASGPALLAGYGPSASMVLAIALEEPAFFSRIALVDGGFDDWSPSVAARLADRGARRVLFACVQARCPGTVAHKVALARRTGLDARSTDLPERAGSTGVDPREPLRRGVAWLLDGEAQAPRVAAAPGASASTRGGTPAASPSPIPRGSAAAPRR